MADGEAPKPEDRHGVVTSEVVLHATQAMKDEIARNRLKRQKVRTLCDDLHSAECGQIDLGEIDSGKTDSETDKP